MRTLDACRFISIIFIIFIPLDSFSQDKKGKKNNTDNYTVELVERDSIVLKSLKKGRVTAGVGGRFKTDLNKNFDDYSQYIIEQNDKDFFLRLTASYFVKNRQSVGVFGRFSKFNSTYSYVTVLGDTINNKTDEKIIQGGIYYKSHTPIFGSKRVYWISQAEFGISSGDRNDKTIIKKDQENNSNTESLTTSLVLRFGILVFPFKNFSIEGTLGAVGLGYEIQNFYYNGEPNGSTQDFFVLLTPELLSIQFRVTTYF